MRVRCPRLPLLGCHGSLLDGGLGLLRVIVVWGLCLIGLVASAAQPWSRYPTRTRFEHLEPRDGLSQGTVYCALQDRRGFLWFGTEDGLNRFDGLRFKVYRGQGEREGLRGNWITALLEDRAGRLWIGTMGGGLHRLDRERDRILNVPLGEIGLFADIRALAEDAEGVLWVGTYGRGLCRVLSKEVGAPEVTLMPAQTGPGPTLTNIQALHVDGRGQIWAGCQDGGLARVERRGLGWRLQPVHFRGESPRDLCALESDRDGQLWAGGPSGLYACWPEEGRLQRFTHDPSRPEGLGATLIRCLYRDKAGILWVGSDGGGLHRMWQRRSPDETPRFQRFQSDARDGNSLSSNAVECLLEDRSGVLWVGCYEGGLNRLILRQAGPEARERRPVVQLMRNPVDPTSLSGNGVNAILEDRRGALWVGTEGAGLNRALPPVNPEAPVRFEAFRSGSHAPGSLQDDVILTLFEDSRGRLWAGTYQGGLVEIRNPGGRPTFVHHRHQPGRPDSLSSNFVTCLAECRDGGLWVGTVDGGLNRFDPDTGRFQAVAQRTDGANSVYAIREDGYGTLWLGTLNGLGRYLPVSGELQVIRAAPGAGRLGHPNVFALHLDNTGMLWLGTGGGGLYRMAVGPWQASEPVFQRFDESAGLPSGVVRSILEDGTGGLLLGTSRSVCRFDPRNGRARSLGWHRELEDGEFLRNAAFRTALGEVMLGGTRGLVMFQPEEVTFNPIRPPVVLTELLLFNQPVPVGGELFGRRLLEGSITETRELVLGHRDYVISVEFAALHFVAPERNRYAYRMEGLEDQWNEVGNRRYITYTTLPPGKYVLRVRGANCDGLWNEEGAALAITVLPPWWGSWWFRSAVVLLGLGLVSGLFRWRMKRLATQNAVLESRVAERTEDLAQANARLQEADRMKERMTAMLVHDLRSPLSGIQSTLDLMEEEDRLDHGLMAACRHSIEHILSILGDMLMVFRCEERGLTLDLELIHLPSMLQRVHGQHQAAMQQRGLHFGLSMAPDLPPLRVDRVKLERALGNLLGNALKFTPREGRVLLEALTEPGGLILRVSDTGRGIPSEELKTVFDPYRQVTWADSNLGSGLGLAIVKRVVEAHGGRVEVVSHLRQGTTFSLHLPMTTTGDA